MKHAATPTSRVIGSARAGVVALGLFLFWLTFGVYVIHTRMPTTALTLPLESQLKPLMNLFLPEGWSFFTKSPRDDRLLPFVRTADGEWISASRGPNAEARNWFGISRASRAQGPELGLLIARVPANAWRDCPGDPKLCLEEGPIALHGRTPSPVPTLCGTVGIVLQPPLPWAWYEARAEVRLPSRVAKLEIAC